MNLTPGTRLDHYEIVELIGKGGMGEVYRAKDTRLPRDVAIKVSAEKFSERFAREAKIIASLNHPNICTLFDVGPNYLVMEMVEGPTLSDRIKEGPLSLDAASGIARQIADALDYAHEKTVVHRDLKPGNVKIRPDGVVKVLDFGLAKAGGGALTQSDNSPTVTMGETQAGVILGTAAYMSPEQALGKTVDKRADIWAFGVVFYEMLSGARLHKGETMQETITSVLRDDPDYTKVPAQAQRLIKRCLEKDAQKRLRHIGDVMALLDDAPSGQLSGIVTPPPASPKKWLWPALAGAAIVAAGLAIWAPWRTQTNLQPIRFEIQSTDKLTLINGAFPMVSPDGRWVVFPARDTDGVLRMWIRALDSVQVRPVAGTETSNALPPPVFWSPDSRFIAFGATPGPFAPGKLQKLDITGGPPQTICDVPSAVLRGAWNRDGVIVFATNVGGGLMRVSAAGGIPAPVTVLDPSDRYHLYPQFLPDGHHFLYLRVSRTNPERTGMYAGSIDVKPEEQSTKPLLLTDRQATYALPPNGGPGRLLFMRDTTLFAQPFDPTRLELSGEPVPIADQVGSFTLANAGLYSVSDNGVLAYRVGTGGSLMQLTWMDSQGKAISTVGDRGSYATPVVSPDGSRIAVSQLDAQTGNSNIWVLEIARGTNTRLTFNSGRDGFPVWSPDGKSIVFASNRAGHMDLYQKPADGSGEERLLLKSEEDKRPQSWSRDGRFLLYLNTDPKTAEDLWVLPFEGDRKPLPLLHTQFRETNGSISPDGRWIAYSSDESGSPEVYVRPFAPDKGGEAASGGKWMVSKGGGLVPRWRADGKELFYINLGASMQMAVDVNADKTFQVGTPRRLFGIPTLLSSPDVSADGKRFLYTTVEGSNVQTPFTIVLNWQSALK